MQSQSRIRWMLAAFMFLQYYVWGAWYVSMGTYLAERLKASGTQIGSAYGAFAIGSMISPFFIGLVADRFFAAQKLLAILAVAGGGLMIALAQAATFDGFYPLLIAYCATYAPTLALGNAVALRNLEDANSFFPKVKVASAVGWIAGGVTLSLVHGERSEIQFVIAGATSIAWGVVALLLPHTPPTRREGKATFGEMIGLDALGLFRKPSFSIFVLCMFCICIPLYFYFVMVGIYLSELKWESFAWKLSLAQVSDVICLLLMAAMLRRWGYKRVIGIGIAAWILRYLCLAASPSGSGAQQALIMLAIVVHGFCYDFLFIAGQLYVDSESDARNRAASQGLIAFVLWGLGAYVGTDLAGRVLAANEVHAAAGGVMHDWRSVWLVPAMLAAVVMVIFAVFFRDKRINEEKRA
jgi:nucleoside transporter